MRVFWRFLQLYLLLFFVCLAESLYAAPKYYFKQISLENGLSQSSVKCVLVDERGVMWIGTRFGLNRFDREKITVYQEERENLHSLPYNDIVFLEEDAEGNIWVGTSRGLACFERDTQKFMRQEIDGQPLVAACSLLMPEGIYFLGKQGVFCYSYAEKKMIRCKFKESPFEFSPNYVYLYDEKERKVILSFLEKVRFMVNISHELRTPLTLIYAPLKRLLKSGKVTDKDVSRQLDGLLLQTCRMREIVDMVLDAQKSDTNGDVMDIRFYDLNDWIRSVTDDFIMEFEARRISVRFQLDASVEKVPFDTSKCRVVLSNLLINAMKFSDPDTSLVIGTERMDKNVRVFLADQGIGLRHVDINRLFTCFYQGEHDRKGSGIGLAYARKLIELHGGSIGAYNNEDGGATFYFDLPFTQAFVAAEPDSVIDLSVKGTDKPETDVCGVQVDTELAKYTLLVVEDEIELRNYLLGVLQAEFKEVFVAGDGEEAWEILGQCQPDIVISDVMMPRTDGFELCYRIKNDVAVSHIPVVLLTARVDQASSVEGYKSGADIYLAKPFDIDSLLVILRNILRQRDLLRVRYRESGCLFSPKEDATSNADEQFMCKLNTLLRENLSNPDLNVPFIASAMAMSRTTLYSKFSHLSDVSVGDYVIRFRMVEASRLLSSHKDISIQEVADRVGFSSARYFSTAFKQSYGVTPTEYRRNN